MRQISMMLLAAALCLPACGSKKSEEEGSTEQSKTPAAEAGGGAADNQVAAAGDKKQLPPPPESAYQGKARIINLYVDGDGNPQPVDVWAKRSFQYAPVKLAEKVELGQASDWFGVPKGQRVVLVATGAGPDAENDFGGIFAPKDGEHVTGVLSWDKARGVSVGSHWETKPTLDNSVPAPPADGKSLVILRAVQLSAHEDALREQFGGRSFYVGTGKGKCAKQRVEDKGMQASILGGTQPVELELDPGKQTITLHKWPSNDKCKSDPVYSFDLELEAGEGTLVQIYTPDRQKLAHASFPLAVGSAAE